MRKTACPGLLALLSATLLAGCMTAAIRDTKLYGSYYDGPAPREASEAALRYERQGRTHVFRLSGDEYGMGKRYGEKARELDVAGFYGRIFDNAVRLLNREVPAEYRGRLDRATVQWLLLDAWKLMEPHVPPSALRMLRGFAEGSGLALEDVYAMHAIPDFTETSCSALWIGGGAVADGSALQVRVLDYLMELGIQEMPAVVFLDFRGGHTVANVGWLGLLGVISGMNDAGLAVSEKGWGNPAGENLHGIPMPFLLLDILRWCDDPAEAAGVMRSRPRTNSYAYVVGSADKGGLAFLTDAYEVKVFRPGQAEGGLPQLPDSVHVGVRQQLMTDLLREARGRVTVDWLRDGLLPAIAGKDNLQCVVYDLARGRFLVADAPDGVKRAADAPYAEFRF